MITAPRLFQPTLLLAGLGIGMACTSSTDGESGSVRPIFTVSPSALNLSVGQTAGLTVLALSREGDTLAVSTEIKFQAWGTAQISRSGCDRVGQPCSVTAISVGADTLAFDIGHRGRCLDGPDCTLREWDSDTVIRTTLTVQ